mgnify:FL=1
MTSRHATRASRLQRIAKVGDALAKAAERAASERRENLLMQKDRLETVERYCADYGGMIRGRELSSQSVSSLRMYREFSGWLTQLSQNQQNEVAQAEFLLESALEEVREKRSFAKAVELAADKSGQMAASEVRVREQKTLDGLVRPQPRSGLACRLQRR